MAGRLQSPFELDDIGRRFVLHWGEMGTRWGISRAVAQIHGLLLVAERPLDAQEISECLSLSRSNVSTGLRELQGWGIVSTVRVLGDRRDNFEAMGDVWEMLGTIADRRIEREIEPTLQLLRELRAAQGKGSGTVLARRIDQLSEVLASGIGFYRRLRRLPVSLVRRLFKLDQRLTRILEKS